MTGLPPLRRVDANDTDDRRLHRAAGRSVQRTSTTTRPVTTGYVETMRIPVVEGRAFNPTDAAATTVLINETMARMFYKDRARLAAACRPSAHRPANIPWFTIVGVLKDVKQGGVDQKTGTELYFNFEQLTTISAGVRRWHDERRLRTTQPADSLAATIQAAVRRLDPSLPIVKLRSMDDVFARGDRPAAPAGAAARHLRRPGDSARGDWQLRRAVVHGDRAAAGDRHPDGARREPGSVLRMVLSQGLA